jgi:CBF1 interacting corepressor
MGGGLAFLTKKSFNPANWSNQKQVWEARQKEGIDKRRIAERDAQLRREREEEDLARAVGGEEGGGRKALSFMYDAGRVPGLERRRGDGGGGSGGGGKDGGGGCDGEGWKHRDVKGGEGGRRDCGGEGPSLSYERQPGDDDAAAAFREILARGIVPAGESASPMMAPSHSAMSREDGSTDAAAANNEARERGDHRTNLEKAVGRGINAGSGVTLAQQMERFPMLKGAPRVLPKGTGTGDKESSTGETDVVGLNFKPLGQVLRNVKCVKCGEWGHTMGDRECKLTGWDPFASVAASASALATSRPPPPAAAAAATPTDATIACSAIGMPPAKIEGRGDEKGGDDRKHIKKEKRHRKDERKRHARDKKGRSHDKRHTSRRRRDRSPSYSSSSGSSSYDSSSEEDGYFYRDRRSRKHGKSGYLTSRRRSSSRRRRHRQDKISDDGSISINRRHRSRKESGSSDEEHKFSTRRDENPEKLSVSHRMPK